jgi:hypothetical protein
MKEEFEYLKSRIEFLESLLEINSATLSKTMETNKKIDYLVTNHSQQ